MATPAQEREAAKVTQAFQAALASQSVEVVAEAIKLWQATPPQQTTGTAAEWLARAIHMILARRSRSRELGLAYYRLVRALRTGKTIADTRQSTTPKYVSLAQLRREFELLVGGKEIPQSEQADDEEISEGDDRIEVERLFDLGKVMDQLDEHAQAAAQKGLQQVGPDALVRANDKLDTEQPAKDADTSREENHKTAGSRQAGTTQRHVANGARGVVYGLSKLDKECIGWVRVSRTGTPCGFCAMLISRGIITKKDGTLGGLYLSKESAGDTGDPADEFHDNCNCVAEPVYSESQFNSDPLYAMNRLYAKQWPQVTEGLTGLDALNAWRTFIRRQADIQKLTAQAA